VNQVNRVARAIIWSPVLWGSIASACFYAPIELGVWTNAFVVRYFAGHWVEYVTAVLFFIGLSELVLRSLNLVAQKRILAVPLLDAIPQGGQSVSHCGHLLARLDAVREEWQDTYLVRRLREALEYVYRKNSADGLDEQVRYLSDLDASRMASGYALVWFVVWAVPIMGFLGTIIGITDAVANLNPKALEQSLSGVTSGLGVAFDTTALSLSLSIVLMFVKYFVERYENGLLSAVDERTNAELVGRFEDVSTSATPELHGVRRMSEAVLASVEKLVSRQAELWQESLQAGQRQWSEHTAATSRILEQSLAGALEQNVRQHAAALAEAEQVAMQHNRQHWERVQQALLQTAQAAGQQQQELTRQGELLLQVVGATEQVARLEAELNRNLSALAGASHFEETVISLSAAIGLLSARLGTGDAPRVELKGNPRKGQAA